MKAKTFFLIFLTALYFLLTSTVSYAEIGKTFTATLPATKPGDTVGNFELILSGLCGKGMGNFYDTKTGHYKYVVTGGDVNGETCAGGVSWWTTKLASETALAGNFTRYGLQLNSLQILQSFNSKVQNSILNAKNNSDGSAYVCDTSPSHTVGDLSGSVDYNWILLRPRTPVDGTIKKDYSIPAQNRAGGRATYSQNGGAITLTGESSFELATLTESNTAYAIGPQAATVCNTATASKQINTNTGADYLDQYGSTYFGKLDTSNFPRAALYISSKSSPLVSLFAPTLTLDTSFMESLDDFKYAALYTSWNSKTAVTTKTALLTPNSSGTSFSINTITDLDNPTTSGVALGTITCPSADWNLPSTGFCKGTLTLAGVSGSGNSVCLISNIGTQKVISCIAQNPADPSFAITLVSTYSVKANIVVTPSFSEGIGCKVFGVTNYSNRTIPTISDSPSSPITLPWFFGPNTFSGSGGYCGTSMSPYQSCNIDVCNNDTTPASDVETIRIAYDDDGDAATTAPAATTNATLVPVVQNKTFTSPDGVTIICPNTVGSVNFTNPFRLVVDYGSGNTEDLIASPNASSFLNLSLSNNQGYSLSSNKLYVNCANANIHHLDQVTVSYQYYPDGNTSSNDGSVTITVLRDDDGDTLLNPSDNCPTVSNLSQTDSDSDGKGDACDNCVAISNTLQTDTDSDTKGDACDNCPITSNSNQLDTDSDGDGDLCDNCVSTSNSDQANTDSDSKGNVCDNCPTVSNSGQTDTDSDTVGDACDNCPSISNSNQADSDSDSIGTVCDNCPNISNNSQVDGDGDGLGNLCDNCSNTSNANQADTDSDNVGNVCDNCPSTSNTDQADSDSDLVGTACDNCPSISNIDQADVDADQDGNACDNCPSVSNADQADSDSDLVGTSCDNCPSVSNFSQVDSDSDTVGTACDNCTTVSNVGQADADSDGKGDVCDNFWTATSTVSVPTIRSYHSAIWTGSKMIIFGGYNGSAATNTGAQYDPATNSWSATTTTSAPAIRDSHTAVWTGTKMIIFGGINGNTELNSGGQYDPSANTWSATTTTAAPSTRLQHTAIWTGTKMVVFGGANGSTEYNTGGQYDPSANSWTATTTTAAPSTRKQHTAIWTGTKMIVFGGQGSSRVNTGAQYDPTANSWSSTITTGAPSTRYSHSAIWSGTKMIIFGGHSNLSNVLNTGGQYDPAANSWSATTTNSAPSSRELHSAIWTGSQMVVFGGTSSSGNFNSGGQYSPTGNSWTALSTTTAPSARYNHTAVWTDSQMLIFGGENGNSLNSGGAYFP